MNIKIQLNVLEKSEIYIKPPSVMSRAAWDETQSRAIPCLGSTQKLQRITNGFQRVRYLDNCFQWVNEMVIIRTDYQ